MKQWATDEVYALVLLSKSCSNENHRQCVAELQGSQDISEQFRESQLCRLQPKWWKCDIKQQRRLHYVIWHPRRKVSGLYYDVKQQMWTVWLILRWDKCKYFILYLLVYVNAIFSPLTTLFTCVTFLSCLRPSRTLYSKKYGVDLIRYTHGDTHTVVYSSNKLDGNN